MSHTFHINKYIAAGTYAFIKNLEDYEAIIYPPQHWFEKNREICNMFLDYLIEKLRPGYSNITIKTQYHKNIIVMIQKGLIRKDKAITYLPDLNCNILAISRGNNFHNFQLEAGIEKTFSKYQKIFSKQSVLDFLSKYREFGGIIKFKNIPHQTSIQLQLDIPPENTPTESNIVNRISKLTSLQSTNLVNLQQFNTDCRHTIDNLIQYDHQLNEKIADLEQSNQKLKNDLEEKITNTQINHQRITQQLT